MSNEQGNQTMKPQPQQQPRQGGQVGRGEFDAFRESTEAALGRIAQAVSQLTSQLTGHQSMNPDMPMSAFPMNSAQRTAQVMKERDRMQDAVRRELATGPKHWWMRLSNMPEQTRVPVGAENEMYAKAKFQEFHNITGIVDQTVRMLLVPMTEEEVAALNL